MTIESTALPLSARLRSATREVHAEAERAGVMRQLLRRTLPRDGYTGLLQDLAEVYRALENGLAAQSGHHALAFIDRDSLSRLTSLERDIQYFTNSAGSDLSPSPTTAARLYAERIAEISRSAPHLLAAHAYVRYLGDLAGGQVLARLVREMYKLPESHGTAFYEFASAAHGGTGDSDKRAVDEIREDFRAGLDAAFIDVTLQDAVIGEAINAFERHVQMFEELEARHHQQPANVS